MSNVTALKWNVLQTNCHDILQLCSSLGHLLSSYILTLVMPRLPFGHFQCGVQYRNPQISLAFLWLLLAIFNKFHTLHIQLRNTLKLCKLFTFTLSRQNIETNIDWHIVYGSHWQILFIIRFGNSGSEETTRLDHKIPISNNSINGLLIYSIRSIQFLHIFYLCFDCEAPRLSKPLLFSLERQLLIYISGKNLTVEL
jgi:hypothetical protein